MPHPGSDDVWDEMEGEGENHDGALLASYIWMITLTSVLECIAWFALRRDEGSNASATARYRMGALGGATAMSSNAWLLCGIFFMVREQNEWLTVFHHLADVAPLLLSAALTAATSSNN